MSDTDRAARWRTHGRARRLGYALLPGDGFSYVLHLRPREWPIMAAHTTVGFVLAVGLRDTFRGAHVGALALGLVAWVVCLNGGTLALNSAFDRDDGDIGYLDAPPPPPRGLAAFGLAIMVVGQGIAALLPREYAIAYVACLLMSLLYSVPPVRLKAVAGADWVINMLGFGALTTYAGWSVSGMPLTPWGWWVIGGFTILFGALYPLTQLYQFSEDASRGDRTLALVLGMRASLSVALALALLAFASFARAAWVAGVAPWQAVLLVVAFVAWLIVLVPWRLRHARMGDPEHKRGMYAALVAWAVTDVAVVGAFGVGRVTGGA